jgi:ABC-type Fe3+ transport system permease subunit
MPISAFDLSVALAIMIGLPVAFIFANRQEPRRGWWLLAGVVALVIIGNIIEQNVGR